MRQRFSFLLLTLTLHISAWAALGVGDTFIVDGITYKVTSVNPKEVAVGVGGFFSANAIDRDTQGAIEIPSSATGTDGHTYSVTSISERAFASCDELTSVTLPNTVSSIGSSAFLYDGKLLSIFIPKSVVSIGNSAFYGCRKLTTVQVEDGNPVFDSRDNCNAIIQTANNELICGTVSTIIPNTVTSIGDDAFTQREIPFVSIPNSVVSIGKNAFYNCVSFSTILIPNSVVTIGAEAFASNFILDKVIIGESVKVIGEKAFSTFYIDELYSLIEDPFAVSEYTFCDAGIGGDTYEKGTLYVPRGTKAKYEATDGWKYFKNIIEMEPQQELEPVDNFNLDFGEPDSVIGEDTDLGGNVVGNIYFNIAPGNGGYDPTDGSIVISETTNMGQIGNTAPGSDDVKDNFTGIILRVAAGKGTIEVNVKTTGNAQLVVQVGNGTPMIASRTEQGDVVVGYDVAEDTYVYIYAIIGSSNSRGLRVAGADEVRIYGISVLPGADGIGTITAQQATTHHYYTLDGRRMEGRPTRPGLYIVDGRKVIVK